MSMNIITSCSNKPQSMTPCHQKDEVIKSGLCEKILKIALPVFIIVCCALQREHLTPLIHRAFFNFCGYDGWVTPTLMISTCLALKYLVFLNQKHDNPYFSNTSRITTCLKEIPKNFVKGICKIPHSLILKIGVIITTDLIFNSFSVNTSSSNAYAISINQASAIDVAVKAPFLEELFFREFIQGSLISTMKLVNLMGSRVKKDVIIGEESLHSISRIFSAVIFGLAHSHQSLSQAISSGISSYYFTTLLYERNGLSASIGIHVANNFLVFYSMKLPKV